MSIFGKGEPLGAPEAPRRYKIKITAQDGAVYYWHKGGRLHVVEEDVARVFVSHFKPELFGVCVDGSFEPPSARTKRVRKVEMEPL